MDFVQREKARAILNHYGAANQRRQLCEECAELIQAVCKYDRAMNDFTAGYFPDVVNSEREIASEIADVLIMIEQIKIAMFSGVHSHEIENQINYKLNRQIERIKNKRK